MQILRKIKDNFNSFDDVFLFVQIFSFATILPFLIKLLTIPQLMKTITPKSKKFKTRYINQQLKDKIVKYTDYILSRNFWAYKCTCFKRSLILYYFLNKLGIDIQICFGVRYINNYTNMMPEKKIEGHAWLLNNGDIFLETNSEMIKTYKITYCFPEKVENNNNRNKQELMYHESI